MKADLIALAVGLLVGAIYGLLNVRAQATALNPAESTISPPPHPKPETAA